MYAAFRYTTKLARKTVLIIGGSSGLGFGVAEACIENNVSRIILSSLRQTKIDAAIDRLKTTYPDTKTVICGYNCDLGNETNLESNIQRLFSQIDVKLDHIVFTAGDALRGTPLSQLDLPELEQAGVVRFFAPFFVAKHGVGHLNPGPDSSITLTTGAAADKPLTGMVAIAAYSAGLHGLTRALALDLKPVRVNLVSPSAVDTELWDTALGPDSHERKMAMFKHHESTVATGRVGQVEDVVESFLYAMKDRNTTGTVIRTDGGYPLM